MNYCIQCGSQNIAYEIPDGDHRPRHFCKICDYVHYQNPRIIVGCIIIDDDKILLAKRGIEPRYGLWNLPAGFMEEGEDVQKGAAREVLEEIGADVDIFAPHCIYSLPHVSQVFIHFLARLKSHNYGPTPESLEVCFFDIKDIPWDSIAFSSTTYALKKYISDKQKKLQEFHIGVKK